MKKITALRPGRGRGKRVNVFLDGKFAFSLEADVVGQEGLRVEQLLSAEQIVALAEVDQFQRCLYAAMHYLSYRPRSESEIRDRFGTLPIEVRHLLDIMSLKRMARHLSVTSIQDREGKIRILFSQETNVEPQDIFRLQEKTAGKITFLPDGFEIDLSALRWEQLYKEISFLFTCLSISDTFNKNIWFS